MSARTEAEQAAHDAAWLQDQLAEQAALDAQSEREIAAMEARHLADIPANPAEWITLYVQTACARLKFWPGFHLDRMAARDVAGLDEDADDDEAAEWQSALHGIGPLADKLAASSASGDRDAFDAAAKAAAEQIRACKREADEMFWRAKAGKGGDVADAFAQCAETDEGPMLSTLRLIVPIEEIRRRMEDGEISPDTAEREACRVLAFGWTLGGLVGWPRE